MKLIWRLIDDKIISIFNNRGGIGKRAYLQKFLQGIGNLEIYTNKGKHTHTNVDLIAGDFWLNVYGESLNVGSDLLTGTGITKYAVIKDMVEYTMTKKEIVYDFALIDLPPPFGALVRAALYSSDYFLISRSAHWLLGTLYRHYQTAMDA